MNNNIKVTVFCLTYNHEKHIRDALDGFVMQKTDFAFEVFVHDDASTDNTAAIIREYEQKYPNIIKAVYQTENQYSQKIPIIKTHLLPMAKGEYFALCEGDDYWTDPLKLQKQYDFLSQNSEYMLCACKTTFCKLDDNSKHIFPAINKNCDYSFREILKHGGGLFATCSLMFKREVYITKPDCFKAKGFGDFQIYLYASICGKVHCLNDLMCVYNSGVLGSWTARSANTDKKKIEHFLNLITMFKNVDDYYNFKYHREISKKIKSLQFAIYKFSDDKSSYTVIQRIKFAFIESKGKIASLINKLCPSLISLKRKLFG